jgi:phosphohistidine phosphatase
MRHAKSAWPHDVPDHDRPLGRRGRRDAPAAGQWLRLAGYVPDHVLCSTARRARETWQLAQAELGTKPTLVFEPRVYEASATGLLELVRGLPSTARTAVVIGHDPGVPGLVVLLAARDTAGGPRSSATALDRVRAKFPTAAIAVLELSEPWPDLTAGRARLTAFVTPRDGYDGGRG